MSQHLAQYGTIVNLLISVTTLSTTKIREEDLGLNKGDIPKEIIKQLATTQLIDHRELIPLNNIARQAHRVLERIALRFLGSSVYFVPDRRIEEVMNELLSLRNQFYDALKVLLARYDAAAEKWADECEHKYPGWGKIIRRYKKPVREVEEACSFGVVPFSVGAPKQDGLAKLYQDTLGGLHRQLLTEISVVMADLYKRAFKGKDRASHKTLETVRNVREKLDGLSFISPEIVIVVRLIDKTLESIPANKNLSGASYLACAHLIQLLSDPERVLKHIAEHGDVLKPQAQGAEDSSDQLDLLQGDSGDLTLLDDELPEAETLPEPFVPVSSGAVGIQESVDDWL